MKKINSTTTAKPSSPSELLTYSRAVLNAARKLNLQIALFHIPPEKKADHIRIRQNVEALKSSLQELEAYLSMQEENPVP